MGVFSVLVLFTGLVILDPKYLCCPLEITILVSTIVSKHILYLQIYTTYSGS